MEEAKESVEEINKDISDKLKPQLENLAMESGKFNLEKAHSNSKHIFLIKRKSLKEKTGKNNFFFFSTRKLANQPKNNRSFKPNERRLRAKKTKRIFSKYQQFVV